MPSPLSLRLKLVLKPHVAIGPGKADLLEAIQETGSIAAGGRRLGMSYRRAWLLVDAMNTCFTEPLVTTAKGGASGGRADLTPTGEEVLRRYRSIEAATIEATRDDRAALERLTRDRNT
jgi:molybdate transport system regulatory protein